MMISAILKFDAFLLKQFFFDHFSHPQIFSCMNFHVLTPTKSRNANFSTGFWTIYVPFPSLRACKMAIIAVPWTKKPLRNFDFIAWMCNWIRKQSTQELFLHAEGAIFNRTICAKKAWILRRNSSIQKKCKKDISYSYMYWSYIYNNK